MKRILFLLPCLIFAQVNTWIKITENEVGARAGCALAYAGHSDQFLMLLGGTQIVSTPEKQQKYSEQMFRFSSGHWMNYLPDPSLYGVWADSFGLAYGDGLSNSTVFGGNYTDVAFHFENITGNGTPYLRPMINNNMGPATYYQYAYNPDDRKIYFYVGAITCTYNTETRRWDTLKVLTHPSVRAHPFKAAYAGEVMQWSTVLKYGSLCYDRVNHEMVWFGGMGADAPGGDGAGTWIFRPADTTWTKLNPPVEPESRCASPMVYDVKNRVIVMFGGDHLDYLNSETWVYACSTRTWSKKNPAIHPGPRAGHAMLYLPKSQAVVLLGGYEYTSDDSYTGPVSRQKEPFEIWRYDAAIDEWNLVRAISSGTIPHLLDGGDVISIIAVNSGDTLLALEDSVTLVYRPEPSTFRMHCDPSVTDEGGTRTHGVAGDLIERRTGTCNPAWYTEGVAAPDTGANEAYLRNMPVDKWVQLNPPKGQPDIRGWGTTTYDPEKDMIINLGGGHTGNHYNDVPQYCPHTNRWQKGYFGDMCMDGKGGISQPGWFTFNNRPFFACNHLYSNYRYDVVLNRLVYVGFEYTWFYDDVAMDWDKEVLPHDSVPGGFIAEYHNLYVVSTPHGAVLWVRGLSPNRNALFRMDSLTRKWVQLPLSGDTLPLKYEDHGCALYDGKRDRLLLVASASAWSSSAQPGQMWSYDFSTGTVAKLNPANPQNIDFATMEAWIREGVYLPRQDICFYEPLRGGTDNTIYDCAANTWRTETIPLDASVDRNNWNGTTANGAMPGYMYDPNRDLIWNCGMVCDKIFALRLSGGVPPESTAVIVKAAAKPAAETFLTANPNPFNPSTSITFIHTTNGPLSLKVYDIRGNLVRTLLSKGAFKQGKYSITWDGRNDRGRMAGAGHYLVKMNSSRKVLTYRVTLAK